ncbi:hypothetical protein MBANPS3_001834 [Mucor bainieri]
MKLRDKRKSFTRNVKQEDCKPALTMDGSSTFTPIAFKTVDLVTVKQEDMKEHKLVSQQHGEFGEKDYSYRCDRCETRMADLKSVLEHRTSIHIDKRYSKSKVKNIDMEPDVHDPNFYCNSCEESYKNTHAYRNHLRSVHYMILKPIPDWKAPRSDIVPDLDDPKLYCKACDRTYTQKQSYRRHCWYAHGMKSIKCEYQSSTSSNTTDSTYCQICDKRLASLSSYRQHLLVVHKVDSRPPRKRSDILPNVNDPNFYCRSCKKKMANSNSFKMHLVRVHFIFQTASRKKSRLRPDVNDPNYHCRACKKTWSSRGAYRQHLRMAHQMILSPLRGNASRTDLPDPYNPDHYCSACKKTYASLKAFRYHCTGVHFMTLGHYSVVNPGATININDPSFYCAQCERSFTCRFSFKKHLRSVHNI